MRQPAQPGSSDSEQVWVAFAAMSAEVGKPAPPFTLRNKDREEVTLDSFPGKHLVLAFYPMAFTGG